MNRSSEDRSVAPSVGKKRRREKTGRKREKKVKPSSSKRNIAIGSPAPRERRYLFPI